MRPLHPPPQTDVLGWIFFLDYQHFPKNFENKIQSSGLEVLFSFSRNIFLLIFFNVGSAELNCSTLGHLLRLFLKIFYETLRAINFDNQHDLGLLVNSNELDDHLDDTHSGPIQKARPNINPLTAEPKVNIISSSDTCFTVTWAIM